LVYRNTATAHAGGAGIVSARHGARRVHVPALDPSSLASVPRLLDGSSALFEPPRRLGEQRRGVMANRDVIGHGFEPVLGDKTWSGGTC